MGVPKSPDPELYIRLCAGCTDIKQVAFCSVTFIMLSIPLPYSVVAYIHIATAVQPYVPTSGCESTLSFALQSSLYLANSDIRPRTAQYHTNGLRDDINFVTDKLIVLASLGDSAVGDRWKAERREDLNNRKTVGGHPALPYMLTNLCSRTQSAF
jgi:hypothetical protein